MSRPIPNPLFFLHSQSADTLRCAALIQETFANGKTFTADAVERLRTWSHAHVHLRGNKTRANILGSSRARLVDELDDAAKKKEERLKEQHTQELTQLAQIKSARLRKIAVAELRKDGMKAASKQMEKRVAQRFAARRVSPKASSVVRKEQRSTSVKRSAALVAADEEREVERLAYEAKMDCSVAELVAADRATQLAKSVESGKSKRKKKKRKSGARKPSSGARKRKRVPRPPPPPPPKNPFADVVYAADWRFATQDEKDDAAIILLHTEGMRANRSRKGDPKMVEVINALCRNFHAKKIRAKPTTVRKWLKIMRDSLESGELPTFDSPGRKPCISAKQIAAIRKKVREAAQNNTYSQYDIVEDIEKAYRQNLDEQSIAKELQKKLSNKALFTTMHLVVCDFTPPQKSKKRSRRRQIAMTSYRNMVQCHCVMTAALSLGYGSNEWVNKHLFVNVDATSFTVDAGLAGNAMPRAYGTETATAPSGPLGKKKRMSVTASDKNPGDKLIGQGYKMYTAITASGALPVIVITFKLAGKEIAGFTSAQKKKPIVVEIEGFRGTILSSDATKVYLVGYFSTAGATADMEDDFGSVVLPAITSYIKQARIAIAAKSNGALTYDTTTATVPRELTACLTFDGAIPEIKVVRAEMKTGGTLGPETRTNCTKYGAANTGNEQANDVGRGYCDTKAGMRVAERRSPRYVT